MLVRDPTERVSPEEMLKSPWVKAGFLGPADVVPLVSYEHVPDIIHQMIVDREQRVLCRAGLRIGQKLVGGRALDT